MKFLISTILTLLVLSPTSVFAEEIKDVGLVCERNEGKDPNFSGVWFEENRKMKWFIIDTSDKDEDDDEFEIVYDEEFSKSWKYTFSRNEISFQYYSYGEIDSNWSMKLDRFNLEMKELFFGVEITHKCEVFESKLDFNNGLKKKEEVVRRHFEKRKI